MYGHRRRRDAGDLHGEKLFAVATGDENRFVRSLEEDASEPKRLLEYDGGAHGQALLGAHGESMRAELFDLTAASCRDS